jgi:hypothetical protein
LRVNLFFLLTCCFFFSPYLLLALSFTCGSTSRVLLVARLALLAGAEDASLVRRPGVVFGDAFSLASVYK